MKALSLWQPWATLVAIGKKEYETRDWTTRHRGLIAIHAAKSRSRENIEYSFREPFKTTLREAGYSTFSALPLGAVLCVCRLTAIYRADELFPKVSHLEQAFGHYAPGRFAWRLEIVEVFDPPIPASGKQGLWDWYKDAEQPKLFD